MSSTEEPTSEYPPGVKTFIPLENNPDVMTSLAHTLGLRNDLAFHDVYSLTDTDLLAFIPRPALALLVIIPMTPAWRASRAAEDSPIAAYSGSGPSEPVLWFKQTIRHSCGLVGLLHCVFNLPDVPESKDAIAPGSLLDRIRTAAVPLKMGPRAQVLYDSQELEDIHMSHGRKGDTDAPEDYKAWEEPFHFVTFAKGSDGQLWELEGGRKGPIARGMLGEDEDLLSAKAYELGMGRLLKMAEEGEGDLRFSATVLAPAAQQ